MLDSKYYFLWSKILSRKLSINSPLTYQKLNHFFSTINTNRQQQQWHQSIVATCLQSTVDKLDDKAAWLVLQNSPALIPSYKITANAFFKQTDLICYYHECAERTEGMFDKSQLMIHFSRYYSTRWLMTGLRFARHGMDLDTRVLCWIFRTTGVLICLIKDWFEQRCISMCIQPMAWSIIMWLSKLWTDLQLWKPMWFVIGMLTWVKKHWLSTYNDIPWENLHSKCFRRLLILLIS